MAEIDWVVTRTRRLESLLRDHYHAEGKGLHQLVTSCEERLPHELIPTLRYIATMRNKVVHEDGYKLDDRKGFKRACLRCEKELRPRSGRFIWGLALLIVFGFTALAAIFYYHIWDRLAFLGL
uniref:DUF4145 domain-containing protein n=1 Tax=Thaumasiovibrio occultus TaxID=1891184 RepID=UPI000B3557E7|nr:DUF4145 domain-containing protein [Thaumasiovibrio occultus]